ncbi:uncharacterized protein BX664DRAFT_336141 [Halteromyces radiatus]|uniref:uncharacterized protein n=1 Tax=Halteromyces radiatus TaxID=101107 RepID=UPI00221EAC30|nr:uncharacterized protein BX664DRAFT_336141 [Halteromyces radiatus]KAI8086559.1 hypothetical protein BX664DRAFT_336141 [Halteromyces radiatus]
MREPNLCFPSHNKAAVCITSALYDRRALDCTASLPMINSLTHLAYLTSTSPRIREILVLDGGLERLVRILSPQHLEPERRSLWKWSLAFQCVVNVGVRGTEQIRTKVVEAGMIPIVLRVLENFLRALELVRQETDRQDNNNSTATTTNNNNVRSSSSSTSHNQELLNGLLSEQAILDSHHLVNTTRLPSFPPSTNITTSTNNNNNNHTLIPNTDDNNVLSGRPQSTRQQHRILRKSTFPYIKMNAAQRRRNRINRESTKSVPTWQDPREPTIDNVFYREEDILLSLQLLAYLSKYPHIRNQFHTNYDRNVFSVVERFCHRLHPNPIQYWAGVIMRNACRKDETKGGTRRCANMLCGKWETQPREFAKCRRCRKAKYCCKACQSKAWADGHRWWCVERRSSVPPQDNTTTNGHSTTTTTNATTTPSTNGSRSRTTTTTTTNTTIATASDLIAAVGTTLGTRPQQHRRPGTMTLMTGATPLPMTMGILQDDPHPQALAGRTTITPSNIDNNHHHRRHHHRHMLAPNQPIVYPSERRPSSGQQQQQQQQQQEEQQNQYLDEQQTSTSSAIMMSNSPLPNSGITLMEQELGDQSQNGSTESSDNPLLMDVGVHMEL